MYELNSWDFGWLGLWSLFIGVLLLLLPLVVPKRRFGYASAMAAAMAILCCALWLRNLSTTEEFGVGCAVRTTGSVTHLSASVDVSCGTMGLHFGDVHDFTPDGIAHPDPPFIQRTRFGPSKEFPWAPGPRMWGFQIGSYFPAEKPDAHFRRGFWYVVFPAWLPIPFLLVLPAFWTRHFLRRRKIRRWVREGCCAHCGFDLRAHKSGERCPECGTVIPEPPKSPSASPSATTGG